MNDLWYPAKAAGTGAESPPLERLSLCQGVSLLTPSSLKKMLQLRTLNLPSCELPVLEVAGEVHGSLAAVQGLLEGGAGA